MINIFIMTGLLIMGITDIKRKAVPLWMLIIFSIFSIIIKVICLIREKQTIGGIHLIYFFIFVGITMLISIYGKMLGLADMILIGLIAFLDGMRMALGVLLTSLFLVSVFAGILLLLKKVKTNDSIAFLPFVLFSYVGVILCG